MMKKIITSIAIVFFILLFMGSCDINSVDADTKLITFDASNLPTGSYPVSASSKIIISSMEKDAMYTIITEGYNGRFVSTREKNLMDNESASIISTSPNSFIPVPDENSVSIFYGNEINIINKANLKIIKLRDGSDDMTIKESEDIPSYVTTSGTKTYEEFYHIDFVQEPYNSLDKTKIVLLTKKIGSGSGGSNWGYVTTGRGGIQPKKHLPGIYNFSDTSYINLYHQMTVVHSESPWTQTLMIKNPVLLTLDTDLKLKSDSEVLEIPPTQEEYVLEITKNSTLYYAPISQLNPRFYDGQFFGHLLELEENKTKTVAYLGKIDDNILLDVSIFTDNNTTLNYGSVNVRKATYEEQLKYSDSCIEFIGDKTEFIQKLQANDDNKYIYKAISNDGSVLNNYTATVEFTYADSNEYITENPRTDFHSGHLNGVGYSGDVFEGSYGIVNIHDRNVLDQFKIQCKSDKAVDVKITFEKKDYLPRDDFSAFSHLFLVKNNGEPVEMIKIEPRGIYTVPKLTREGHTYNGMYYLGKKYTSGQEIKIQHPRNAIIASWSKID